MILFLQLLLGALVSGSIYSLMMIGFNLVYKETFSGDFLFGTASVIAVYLLYFIDKELSLHGVLVFPIILFVILILWFYGLLIDAYVYKALKRIVGSGMSIFIFSFGAYFLTQGLVTTFFGDQFNVYSFLILPLNSLGVIHTRQLLVLFSALLCLLSYFVIIHNSLVLKKYYVPFGFACAAIAAILYSIDLGFQPLIGMTLLLPGISAAIIGGLGNMRAGIFVAFLIGLAESFGSWQFNTSNRNIILLWFLVFSFTFIHRKTIFNYIASKFLK